MYFFFFLATFHCLADLSMLDIFFVFLSLLATFFIFYYLYVNVMNYLFTAVSRAYDKKRTRFLKVLYFIFCNKKF